MQSFVLNTNARWVESFLAFFRPRDLFIHDGARLRRFHLSRAAQLVALVLALVSLATSVMVIGTAADRSSDARGELAEMKATVAAMKAQHGQAQAAVARIAKRQAFLDALVEGKNAAELSRLLPLDTTDGKSASVAPLKAIEHRQNAFVERALAAAQTRYTSTAGEIRRLGLAPQRFTGMGGPYEPLTYSRDGAPKADAAPRKLAEQADPQFRALFVSWRKLDQLQQGVIAIPSIRPVGTASFTSGFGVRSDPFRGGAAMHAGIDLAGPIGTPIFATADGIVSRSEWANGYGNLVEVDHGKGISTRYGHLSKLLVKPHTRVKRGQLIALMGSTGRSTGSHLHYEVRIDGRAVNPIPFLQTSDYLLAMQRRMDQQVALGGPDN